MNSRSIRSLLLCPVVFFGWTPLALAQTRVDEIRLQPLEPTVALSPFVVDERTDQSYFASQTLAGGRMRQDIKDIGSSIQAVTKELMDDLGVTGVEELSQYTTSTEVGGIIGNFTGSNDASARGDANIDDARRDPDGTTRIRGLAAPDRARDFPRPTSPSILTTRIGSTSGAAPIPCSS